MEATMKFRLRTVLVTTLCLLCLQMMTAVAFPMVLENSETNEQDGVSYNLETNFMELILTENDAVSEDVRSHLVEGDMFVATADLDDNESPHLVQKRNALRDRTKRWPNGVVPYIIDEAFGPDRRNKIVRALNLLMKKASCIQFIRRTDETDYLHITPSDGCWSSVGRVGGRQELSLGGSCTSNQGTILHELMHALGFKHEQSRPDRDNYVIIKWENINPNKTQNFEKYNQSYLDQLNTAYDLESVMHYDMKAFSINGETTIVPIEPNSTIGNNSKLSTTDVVELRRYYECSCKDLDSDCGRFPREDCETNPSYMLTHCRKTCKICGRGSETACTDKEEYCSFWKEDGLCSTNKFVRRRCKRSCGVCQDDD